MPPRVAVLPVRLSKGTIEPSLQPRQNRHRRHSGLSEAEGQNLRSGFCGGCSLAGGRSRSVAMLRPDFHAYARDWRGIAYCLENRLATAVAARDGRRLSARLK
jgi:hypothetical protein